ncbi:MAG: hypothetical protein JWL99_2194 [Streptomyces oryziradicis]|nr:hypothetical protein [Actinacidiphila oryziradicis]
MLGVSAGGVRALTGGILFGPGLAESRASSHWDAPMVVTDPQIDAGIGSKTGGPLKDDLNAHSLNQDADPSAIAPAEELRLNLNTPVTAQPNKLGCLGGDRQGFPNGRRLTDDPTVAMLSMLQGGLLTPGLPGVGDDVMGAEPQTPPGKQFPYIPAPLHL